VHSQAHFLLPNAHIMAAIFINHSLSFLFTSPFPIFFPLTKRYSKVELISDCCILAAVGDQMVNTPGLAAKFFGALGDRDINILAIAQGSSERNISVCPSHFSSPLSPPLSPFLLSPSLYMANYEPLLLG
jgi:hypothetical protein